MNFNKLRVSRFFYVLAFISVLVLFLLGYVILPYFLDQKKLIDFYYILSNLTNNLIVAIVTSVIIAFSVDFFIRAHDEGEEFYFGSSRDLLACLKRNSDGVDDYRYCGHTARWNRYHTFKNMKDLASQYRRSKKIELIILNPSNDDLCKRYINSGYAARNIDDIDFMSIKAELVVTIMKCFEYRQSPFVEIDVFLTERISIFRFDITSKGVVVTLPNKGEGFLFFGKNHYFYSAYVQEFKMMVFSAKRIDFSLTPKNDWMSNIESFIEVVQALSILDSASLGNRDFLRVIYDQWRDIQSPY